VFISGSGGAAETRDQAGTGATEEGTELGAEVESSGGVDEKISGVMRHTHILDDHLQSLAVQLRK